MIRWLNSVKFKGLHPVMILVAIRVDAYLGPGTGTWITSGNDSKHMDGSHHYTGRALDFRTHHLDSLVKDHIVADLQVMLGPEFFIQLEDRDGPNEHLHIQYNGE